MKKSALILIDLQNDFCEGGRLAVPDGNAVIPLANQLQKKFKLIIASKDWHPKDHVSFATNHDSKKPGDIIQCNAVEQVLWPEHCVQDTKGADFHSDLDTTAIDHIVYKGTQKEIDSYSIFFDNAHSQATGLAEYLRVQEIETLYIAGLATDYCVNFSCQDAINLGFETFLIIDACRGVELNPGDVANTLDRLHTLGVKIIKSLDIP